MTAAPTTTTIRKRVGYGNLSLDDLADAIGELARDTDQAISALKAQTNVFQITRSFLAPFYLSLDSEPVALELIRIVDFASPSTVVTAGTRVAFSWDSRRNRALVDDIEGLTAGPTQYVMTFRASYL